MTSVVGDIFGSGDSPGVLGTGQYHSNPYTINTGSFTNMNATQTAATDQALQNAKNPMLTIPTNTTAGQATLTNAKAATQAPTSLAQASTAQGTAAGPATIATGPQNQDRAVQQGLMGQLQQQANGQGPSLAQQQLEAGTQRGLANSLAAAASARGNVNGGLTQQALTNNAATAQAGLVSQAAQARTAEQIQAQQQLAGLAGQTRDQDVGLATGQAGLEQQANLTNAQLQQQANLANAQNATGVSLANAAGQNTTAANNAQLQQATNLANAGAANTISSNNAQLQQANSLADMSNDTQLDQMQNQYQLANLQLAQQGGQWQQGQLEGLEQLQSQNTTGNNNIQAGAYSSAASHNPLSEFLSDEDAKISLDDDHFADNAGDAKTAWQGFNTSTSPKSSGFNLGQAFQSRLSQGAGGAFSSLLTPSAGAAADSPEASADNPLNQAGFTDGADSSAEGTKGDPGKHEFNMSTILAAMSDEDAKHELTPTDDAMEDFMGKAEDHAYVYKDPNMPGAAPGVHYGPFAGELQQSAAGANTVKRDPNTGFRMVDTGRLSLTNTAALNNLHKRLSNLEAATKKKGRAA